MDKIKYCERKKMFLLSRLQNIKKFSIFGENRNHCVKNPKINKIK